MPLKRPLDRRELLFRSGGGLGGLALASLMGRDGLFAEPADARGLHFPPRAQRVIQLFMAGAASHLDLFDHKPELEKHHGKPWDPGEKVELFQSEPGQTLASPWKWRRYGACGKALSEIAAPLGDVVDELAFIHTMVGKTGVHSTATLLQTTGFVTPGFPSAGAWVSYGLGSLSENLPTFVVLPDHRGFPSNGQKNWDAGFLPTQHQGTLIRPGAANPIEDLFPSVPGATTAAGDAASLALLKRLNQQHAGSRQGDPRLDARIRAYEQAARLQLAAPEALDLSREPKHVLKLYGLDQPSGSYPTEINEREETEIFARKCLLARRLIERGVRFVQVWSGCDNGFPRRNWDSHEDIARDHGPLGLGMARGVRALLLDLKQRGLLNDTIVHWTTEFGRMPCAQGGRGRDHNPFCFTHWLAGGGIRGGYTHGASDVWGYKPANPRDAVEVHDVHATILRLLGIDHTKLTVRHNGIDRRLTDVHGHVITGLLG
jgi:hypothetical protein